MKKHVVIALCILSLTTTGIACTLATIPLSLFPADPDFRPSLPISGPIKIRNDAFGVPHVTAETDADLYFAMGFVHARDRLAQMDQTRTAAKARLSSIFGADFLGQDILVLGLELDRRSADILANMNSETRTNLEGYVAGINTVISPVGLPFELALLGRVPEPWTVDDVIRSALFLAFQTEGVFGSEDSVAQLILGLGADATAELFPRVTLPQSLAFLSAARVKPDTKMNSNRLGGSNNWVVSGARTASGFPLLANDPHLPITLPSIWHLMVADTPTRSFRGATIPGLPIFLIGTNGKVSTSITLTVYDLVDTYVEVLDETRTKYMVAGQWRDLRFVTSDIPVFGELLPRKNTQAFTHRGPLVLSAGGKMISMQWAAGDVASDLGASLELLGAQAVDEAIRAARKFEILSVNYVLADAAGNVGWQATGHVPRRGGRTGQLPADGTQSDNDWKGFFLAEDLPHSMNPTQGFIATANDRPVGSDIPDGSYARFRIDRIEGLLAGLSAATMGDMARMQQDVQSLQFESYRKAILDAAGIDAMADSVIDELTAWDGRMSVDSRPALLFDQLLAELAELVIADRLPSELVHSSFFLRTLEGADVADWPRILANPDSVFWTTAELGNSAIGPPSRRTVMATALRRAAEDAAPGVWGDIHRYYIRNQFSQLLPFLTDYLDLPSVGVGGSATTVFANIDGNQLGSIGSSLRLICDMEKPDQVQLIIPGGQSGRPSSPHYRDQYDLWLRGEYMTLPSPPKETDRTIMLSP